MSNQAISMFGSPFNISYRARVLARDTIRYIESIISEWNSSSSIEPTEDEKQLILDLLYSVLKKSLLFCSPLISEIGERLVRLCEQYKKFPRMLEVRNLNFIDFINRGGNAEIYLAEFEGREVVVKVPINKYRQPTTNGEYSGWTVSTTHTLTLYMFCIN